MYPDDLPEFVEAVRIEATAAVKRIRHRASLALWCGGNENQELAEMRWSGDLQATHFFGDKLIHETLPAVLAELDPDTPYWANSPYSGVAGVPATSDDYGDAHYWKVWHGLGDWIHYSANDCRFSSEFGFASPCGFAAWESCTDPADRTPRSAVAQWHDKTRKGYETYLGYIELHFPKIETWDDLVYYGQANQAMALSYGVEHWRRRKGRCWGTLFWQINDCWPTQSWAVLDSAGEGKLAYYAAKRTFYQPVLLSLVHNDRSIGAHVVNDTADPVSGTLSVSFRALSNGNTGEGETFSAEVLIGANATNAGAALTVPIPDSVMKVRLSLFVHARLTSPDGAVLGENILFLGEPKDLRLPDPDLIMTTGRGENGAVVVTLRAETFAAFVHLRLDGLSTNGIVPQLSDNGFHLLPGEPKAVIITGLPVSTTPEEVAARLTARWLVGDL